MLVVITTCFLLAGTELVAGAKHDPITDLVNTLWQHGGYSIVLNLLNATGHLSHLRTDPNITVFLPTDAAIQNSPPEVMTSLTGGGDPALAKRLLDFHIDNQEKIRLVARKVNDYLTPDTMAGLPVRLNIYRGALNIMTAEGVKIVEPNIRITNGYVHGLGGVMVPPEGSALQLIENHANLSIFNTLLDVAGLKDVIRDDENITIFAPSNAAFSKLDSSVIDYLKGNADKLKEVLLYHVVDSTTLYSAGMRHSMTFTTSDGAHDRIMTTEDGSGHLYLNGALVSEADVSATNGVLHVLEEVLLPVGVLLHLEGMGFTVLG